MLLLGPFLQRSTVGISASSSLRDIWFLDNKVEYETKASEIRLWAIRNNVPQNTLKDLLKTLRK